MVNTDEVQKYQRKFDNQRRLLREADIVEIGTLVTNLNPLRWGEIF